MKFECEINYFDTEDVIACSGRPAYNWTIVNKDFEQDPHKDTILDKASDWLYEHGYYPTDGSIVK